jgi:S-(hydroxymethyl)glutathione dehydrogenase / alcohol dehydrogenase
MKTTAAILVETGKPLELAQLDVPVLKPGQVLVEIAFSGICHTQLSEVRGHRGPDAFLPHCLGHEATGTVRELGPGVTKVADGDRVVLSWIKGSGANVPGTVYGWDGRKVNAGGVTTFMRHAVISENRLTRLPPGLDPAEAVMLGCALPTGMGAVMNTARAEPGSSLVVMGAGGIGLCAIMAAKASGCIPIIAVDPNAMKRALALELGATHAFDPTVADPVKEIRLLTNGGADYAIEATGRPDVMLQAAHCVRPQGGCAVIIGNAHAGETVALDPRILNDGKSLLGTWGGDSQPDRDVPRFARLLAAGRIAVKPLLSKPYKLADVDIALNDLESGRVGRPLIDMSLV